MRLVELVWTAPVWARDDIKKTELSKILSGNLDFRRFCDGGKISRTSSSGQNFQRKSMEWSALFRTISALFGFFPHYPALFPYYSATFPHYSALFLHCWALCPHYSALKALNPWSELLNSRPSISPLNTEDGIFDATVSKLDLLY